MTRIMTISSGLARTGKTHLAVNLALEMVRRGHQAAVFNQTNSRSSIDDLLNLPQAAILQRRSSDHGDALVRRGYQGIDLISSGIPLSRWDAAPEDAVQKIIDDLNVSGGYDDFLIDTSGMDARAQLACCRASSLLVLIITPDPRSRSEAFALLRILQLNGFAGDIRLLVNQAILPTDVDELYQGFNSQLVQHLGLDVPLLGGLANDAHVPRAEHAREAFSSLFPDAEVSSQTVVIADSIDVAMQGVAAEEVSAYWSAFREMLSLPVALPGGVSLKLQDDSDGATDIQVHHHSRESGKDAMLLQFESCFHEFSDALDRLPALLHATADDVAQLHRYFDEVYGSDVQVDMIPLAGSDGLLHFAVSLIRSVEPIVFPVQMLSLKVFESRVRGEDADWLQAGCYLKFIFRLPDQEDILSQIKTALVGIAGFREDVGAEGETVWEILFAERGGCMNIIHAPGDHIRIQVWLPLGQQSEVHQGSLQQPSMPVLSPSKRVH